MEKRTFLWVYESHGRAIYCDKMSEIVIHILQALWFFLPAYVANMTPVFIKKLKLLDMPVNKKYFGEHKTQKGIFFGAISGAATAFLQMLLYSKYRFAIALSLLDYTTIPILTFGFLLGFGALLGDLIKSYFKRKAGIKPAVSWIPFDQLDFVVGGLVLSSIIYFPGWKTVIIILTLSPLLHMASNYIGYKIGLKKTKL